MGLDAWGDGQTEVDYLADCHNSTKYKRGQWFVLVDDHEKVVSSLITYKFTATEFGIGSIATPTNLRKKGFASRLIQGVVSCLNEKGIQTIYLFADVDPKIYERQGFSRLPDQFQSKKDSICMAWGTPITDLVEKPGFQPPSYF